MNLPPTLEKLADELARLPGIGPKTAQRLAFFLMKCPLEEALELSRAIAAAREKVRRCSGCGFLTETDPCSVCRDTGRDETLLCVVEESKDIVAMEKTGYRGKYFVLNSDVRLLNGLDLRSIEFDRLFDLIRSRKVKEVIVATNPTIDGEVVARYIAEETRNLDARTTKLAYGLPVGGDIEYIDELTLRRALDGRKEI